MSFQKFDGTGKHFLSLIFALQYVPVMQPHTAQIMKYCIEDFFGKCDQIRRKLYLCAVTLKY